MSTQNSITAIAHCHQRQAQAAALRNLPLRSIPSLAPALHAVSSRHPFTWPWAAMGFARAQPAPASPTTAPALCPPLCSPRRPSCPLPLRGKLFQIVLGLMCPAGLSGGGESQNEAKSRRFGMDMPFRAFYEGVNPKMILNNCHQLGFNRHRRRNLGVRQPKSALCHLPEYLVLLSEGLVPNRLVNDVPSRAFQRGWFHQTRRNRRVW